ncbi:MAG: reverse transcriptase domain-containing protein, partial [Candidatus Woesearchaeota archaeon]
NVYLNELDQFVKHKLKAQYYIRYVDDFVIIHSDKNILSRYKVRINEFLNQRLDIELHPDKTKITILGNSLTFLGFRIFYYHKLLKKSNLRKMKCNLEILKKEHKENRIDYDYVYASFEGWTAYTKNAETYNLRKKILKDFENEFPNQISTKEINRFLKMRK